MKRWIYLGLGMAANIAQGVAYAGSVFSVPVLLMVGVENDPAAIKTHWQTVFTLSIMFLPVGMILAGRLADRSGPRLPIAVGAVVFALALFIASQTTSYSVLCFSLGFLLSMGSGLAYGPIVASVVRWFPDRKGLASGLIVGALGFGPVVIAPLCAMLMNNLQWEISSVLLLLGVLSLIAIGAASQITSPPSAPQPSPAQQTSAAPAVSAKKDYNWLGMIQTREFWVLSALFFLGTAPGLMVISQTNSMFAETCKIPKESAWISVVVLAAANTFGRILWGAVSDYLGRFNTLTVMFICSTIGLAIFPSATSPAFLLTVIFLIGTTYGGYLGLFPSLCADSFGLKNMSLNYAILFIAFAIAAIVGPRIYGLLEMQQAFYIAAAFSLVGCVGTFGYNAIFGRKKS